MDIDAKFIIQRQGKDMVLYQGLLDACHRAGVKSVQTMLTQAPMEDNGHTAIAHARVEMTSGQTFDGIGDANEKSVGAMIKVHIIRMAETRAKARAMRDAINIGMVSVEEMGEDDPPHATPPRAPQAAPSPKPQPKPEARPEATKTVDEKEAAWENLKATVNAKMGNIESGWLVKAIGVTKSEALAGKTKATLSVAEVQTLAKRVALLPEQARKAEETP